MKEEIVLPAHLYDRIKMLAAEHGGIGRDRFFTHEGAPNCAHGLAWGTCERMEEYVRQQGLGSDGFVEPELRDYLSWYENDQAVIAGGAEKGQRISFELWCELLNVKRGSDVLVLKEVEDRQTVSV